MNFLLLTSAGRLSWNLVCLHARSLAIFLAVACSFGAALAASTYPVLDAGYRLARHGKLYWLDDQRVLFYGGSAEQGAKRAGASNTIPAAGGTYIWNIATGSLEHVSEWEITCYHPDYSTWSLVRPAENEYRFKAGKFGQEIEISSEKLTVQQRMQRVRSEISCKTYLRSELEPPSLGRRKLAILRDGHGYLDLGPNLGADATERRAKPQDVVLYQATGSDPIGNDLGRGLFCIRGGLFPVSERVCATPPKTSWPSGNEATTVVQGFSTYCLSGLA